MRRIIGALVATVVLASCAGGADGGTSTATATEAGGIASMAASPDIATVAAAGAAGGGSRSITVGGAGAEYAPPARSIVNLAVHVRRSSVEEAGRAASAAADAVIGAVEASGVSAAGIQTSDLRIDPVYDTVDWVRITGYEVTLGYNVTFEDIDDVGAVLGAAIVAGGDDVRAYSVRFEPDPSALMGRARERAWEDVAARAAATAELAGEPLGAVMDVHEKVLITSPQGMSQGGEGDSAAFDIPLSPGASGVTVLLTVTYAIG